MQQNRTARLRSVAAFIAYAYVFIAVLSIPYYNWRFAHENGFTKWFVFGEVTPTLQGAAWPYAIYSAHRRDEDAAKEQAALERYRHQMAAAYDEELQVSTRLEKTMINELNGDSTPEHRKKVAALFFPSLSESNREFISRLEAVAPPKSAKEYHSALIEMRRGLEPYMDAVAAKAVQLDRAGYQTAELAALKYGTESCTRINAIAKKSHMENWVSPIEPFTGHLLPEEAVTEKPEISQYVERFKTLLQGEKDDYTRAFAAFNKNMDECEKSHDHKRVLVLCASFTRAHALRERNALASLSAIVPPQRAKPFHDAMVEGIRNEIPFIDALTIKYEHGDLDGADKVNADKKAVGAQAAAKIKAEAEKLHIKDFVSPIP